MERASTVGVAPRPSGYRQDEKHCEELHVVAEHGLKSGQELSRLSGSWKGTTRCTFTAVGVALSSFSTSTHRLCWPLARFDVTCGGRRVL